jgi:protein O-mannosyl-transferase
VPSVSPSLKKKRHTPRASAIGFAPETRKLFAKHENLAFLVAGALLLTLLYFKAITAPFVYDDLAQVVHNPNLAPWSIFAKRFLAAPVAFTSDLGGAAAGSTYRPLFWLSIAIDYHLYGIHPLGFHITNLLLHLFNGFLGFCLLRKLQVSPLQSAAALLLWLALPINSEVVAWVSARSYELCGLFLLLALLSALAYRRTAALWWPPIYLLASLCALLSHELGVLCLPFTLLIFFSREALLPWKRLAPLIATAVIADALYLALKSLVGAASPWHPSLNWASAAEFRDYLTWIALPIRMSVERSTSTPANQPTLATIAALLSLIAILAACFLLRRRLPRIAAGLLWMTLALLPFCAGSLYQGMAERFTYIASAGFAFALVTLIASLITAFKGAAKPLLIAAFAAYFLWSALRTASRASDWHDPVSLYSSSLNANPNSPTLTSNLAFSLRQEGDLQGAEEEYRHTLELDRTFPHALTSLGEIYLQTGRLDDAERQFVRAIALTPTDSSAYTNLGVVFSAQDRPFDAARMFWKAIDNKATDPTPYFNLAVLMQQAGHSDIALPLYRKVLELQPGDPATLENLKKMHAAP